MKSLAVMGCAVAGVSACLAMDVPSGTVSIDTSAYVAPANPAPAVLTGRAAFWADMSSASVVEGDGQLSRWRDARETAAAAATPTRYYAEPAWFNATTFDNVKPTVTTLGAAGRKTMYFNGASGQYLRLKLNGADTALTPVRHFFFVHFPTNYFGAVIGHTENYHVPFYLNPTVSNSFLYEMSKKAAENLFWNRIDLNDMGGEFIPMQLRVDGELIDPFAYLPHVGWQVWEGDLRSPTAYKMESIFYQNYGNAAGRQAGGDYLCELIVFTNDLTTAEAAAVRTYLDRKWNLPAWRDPDVYPDEPTVLCAMPDPTTGLVAGSDATITADVPEGTVSRPWSFAGDGTLVKKGPGQLMLGASCASFPFAGTCDLQAGGILLHGGAAPALTVSAGDTVSSDDTTTEHTSEGVRTSGVLVTRTANAGGDTVTKAGEGPAAIADIGPEVRRLQVLAGELTLGAPKNTGYRGALQATVPNGDFEEPFAAKAGNAYAKLNCLVIAKGATSNGWTSVAGNVIFARTAKGLRLDDGTLAEDMEGWSGWTGFNILPSPGAGCQLLHLYYAATAATTITVPRSGYYVARFDMASRHRLGGTDRVAEKVAVRVGSSTADWKVAGYCQATKGVWSRMCVPLSYLEAGTHAFGFENLDNYDMSTFIDNVRVEFVSDTAPEETFPVPNGDFEDNAHGTTSYAWYTLDNLSAGWTFSTTTVLTDNSNAPIGIVNPNMSARTANDRNDSSVAHGGYGLNLEGRKTHGIAALMMSGNTSEARTTFTPPAGDWRVRLKLKRTPAALRTNWINSEYRAPIKIDVPVVLAAGVSVGAGAATPLGTVTTDSKVIEPFGVYDFPVEFSCNGETAVTLSLSNATATTGCLIDDVVLIGRRTTADADEELVKDGGLEQGGAWTGYKPYGEEDWKYCGAGRMAYLGIATKYYGYSVYEGKYYMHFQNRHGECQRIDFPSAGWHRLRFALSSRTDTESCSGGILKAYLASGATTNWLFRIRSTFLRNFTEREYLFNVPAPGSYVFGFESYGKIDEDEIKLSGEGTSRIDGISIRRVDWDLPERLSMDESVKVKVARHATLNLAFTGTNVVSGVSYDGVRVPGPVINKETCPQFVSGPGTFLIKPTGLIIVIK